MAVFLKDNAMLVSSLAAASLTVVFAFTHFTRGQTAALVGLPSAVGNFLAHLVLRNGRNGNGHG